MLCPVMQLDFTDGVGRYEQGYIRGADEHGRPPDPGVELESRLLGREED